MRFARKLALALWIGVCLIYVANAAQRVLVEMRSFEADMRRDHAVMALGLAPAASLIWEVEGQERALAVVEQTNRNTSQLTIRWIDPDAARGDVDAPAAPAGMLDPVRRGEPVTWVDRVGVGELHTYVPLRVDGAWRGALEFTESLQAERAYLRASIQRVLITTMLMALFAGALTLFLGIRFVGRPIGLLVEKARRVGSGDFSGPLVLDQDDEIGELAREMNVMTDRLSEARAQVDAETAARLEAIEQLRHGDRLATVGQLSSGLAHELGTPLNVITQRAKMVATGEVEGEEARANARIVAEQSERITHIVRQLLDFARRRPPEVIPLDIPAAVERVFLLLAPLARKRGVRLHLQDRPAVPPRASADPVQLQQVFTNLALNAIQAMSGGGEGAGEARGEGPGELRASVWTEHRRAPDRMGGDARSWVVVAFEDQGPGVDPAHLAKLFDPFFTTKAVGEGTGLGLSVAWGIVAEHGGWIDVVNNEHGACFRVFLPEQES